MSKGLKGCLVVGVVVLVLLVAGAVAAVFFVGRSIENAAQDLGSGTVPSAGDVVVTVQVGEGFDVRGADIEDGWGIESSTVGSEVTGMQAQFDDESRTTPTVFTMRFAGTDGGTVDTLCTADPSDGAVRCVPLFGEVDESGEVQVVPTF